MWCGGGGGCGWHRPGLYVTLQLYLQTSQDWFTDYTTYVTPFSCYKYIAKKTLTEKIP